MRRKILLLFFITLTFKSFSQWSYKTVKSDFDGTYKRAIVVGSGGEYPYKNPYLVVRYGKENGLDIYISDAGYSGCDNRQVLFKFNGDDEKYKSKYINEGANSDSWFISSLENSSLFELLDKFMKHSYVSVRLSNDCVLKDYRFTLSGSSNAIKNIIPKEILNKGILAATKKKERREILQEIKKKERNEFNKQQRNIDSISKIIYTITNKLRKLSSFPSLKIKSLNRENMIGEKVKFMIKKYKLDYQNFKKADNSSNSSFLKYEDFSGRIATIIDLVKEDYSDVEYFNYKLELDDNKEIVYLKLSEYENFNYEDIGFVSLLEKARNKYLGKTFWKEKSIDLVEYKISKITFAGVDEEVFGYGAFNVQLETKRYFNRSKGTLLFNSQKPKVISVNFSKTYSSVEKNKSYPKEKFFENIFYYLEE